MADRRVLREAVSLAVLAACANREQDIRGLIGQIISAYHSEDAECEGEINDVKRSA